MITVIGPSILGHASSRCGQRFKFHFQPFLLKYPKMVKFYDFLSSLYKYQTNCEKKLVGIDIFKSRSLKSPTIVIVKDTYLTGSKFEKKLSVLWSNNFYAFFEIPAWFCFVSFYPPIIAKNNLAIFWTNPHPL